MAAMEVASLRKWPTAFSFSDNDSLSTLSATVRRGFQEPPSNILRFDGGQAVGIAISTVSGGNVVTMGQGLKNRFFEIESTFTPEVL